MLGVGVYYFFGLFEPTYPHYDEVLQSGTPQTAIVTDVGEYHVKVKGRRPKTITYRFGDPPQTGSMVMAVGSNAKVGDEITVKVLNGTAYPTKIQRLQIFGRLRYLPLFIAVVGLISMALGVARLVFWGAVVAIAARN